MATSTLASGSEKYPTEKVKPTHSHKAATSTFHSKCSQLIDEILAEDDLYRVLGCTRDATPIEIRRGYLDRAKFCHPDRASFIHPLSKDAFQRLSFAYEILRSRSSRSTYDRASRGARPGMPSAASVNGVYGEYTFGQAVAAVLTEFMQGDFALVKTLLEALQKQYPRVISSESIDSIERSFHRLRDLILTTRSYALLVSIELGRINRAQKNLRALRYLDLVGRTRMTIRLVKVTLAVPMRVDRALRMKKERDFAAKKAGWTAAGIAEEDDKKGGILNERVLKVLEFIVGDGANDEEGDEAWTGPHTPGSKS
ncbi:DnaJ-domain-containing protein [Ascobolus immersus RN42]|uniref:DnaJ-domain-containing protein n=1 Tax=Ascobolus immersus RN42 TaxID=1160509 RepID=A0A3N4HSH9_ASCIM|nr:DnaJ-domain-containing protein [Ascobolus immersus RN42]